MIPSPEQARLLATMSETDSLTAAAILERRGSKVTHMARSDLIGELCVLLGVGLVIISNEQVPSEWLRTEHGTAAMANAANGVGA